MPQFQPQPMVVIRNQLLAFLVLNLLGSCVPTYSTQPPLAVADHCCQQSTATAKALTSQIKLVTPYTPTR